MQRFVKVFLVTGCIVSLGTMAFAFAHCGDRDPWQWPSAIMCVLTVPLTLTSAMVYGGIRLLARAREASAGRVKPLHSHCRFLSFSLSDAMVALLACALYMAVLAPIAKDGLGQASYRRSADSIRALSRNELRQIVRRAGVDDVDLALSELQERGFNEDDRATLAAVLANEKRPAKVRHLALVHLTDFPLPHPPAIIETVAKGLESKDPDVQLSAAWALGEMVPDAPTKFEIYWGNGGSKLFWEKYRANVPLFRQWWKSKKKSVHGNESPNLSPTASTRRRKPAACEWIMNNG